METIATGMFGVPGEARMPGGVVFPLRMTVVILPDGGLWLHSPVPVDDDAAASIDALGEVRHIVAPTLVHTLHLEAAQARWPDAHLHATRGIEGKVPGLRIDATLTGTPSPAWGDAFDAVTLEGAPTLNEVVFLHRASGSALLSDLVFNFSGSNLATRAMLWMVGCSHGMAASRNLRWVFVQDRPAFGAAVRRILEWDIQRVVPCHGQVVAKDAHAALCCAVERVSGWQ